MAIDYAQFRDDKVVKPIPGMSLRAGSVVRLLNQLRLQPISELSLAYYVPTLTYGAIHQLWGKCVLLARLTAAPFFLSAIDRVFYN